jgi:DNA-binding transcriptional LysR family regulator
MNLAGIDLNLLVALDALISEAHVGRAASRIGLSQPAASHALQRLREIIGDPLLVRAGGRMQLTPRAEALRAPLAEVLEQARRLFVDDEFQPAASTRRFLLMMPDHVVDLLMPALIQRTSWRAPGVRLDVVPWRGAAAITGELARTIDIVIACTSGPLAGFHQQSLFADTEAIAVRRVHRVAARLRQREAYLKARHVAVVGRGQREDPVDTWLRENGIERRIAIVVPSYLQALHVVARTDLVGLVPRRLIEALKGPLCLMAVTPPIDPGLYEESMFHPVRADAEAGSIWLRNQILEIARRLDRR